MEYDELVYACAINRIFNYACDKARLLVDKYPLPSEVFKMSRKELLSIFGPKSRYVDDILDGTMLKMGERDVEWARSHGVRIYYIGDSDYPYRLKECVDAPVVLYYKGTADLNSERVVSIVGSRHPTTYGVQMCESIVKSFAELKTPPLVVSGLAYGIDITAHNTSLAAGLSTVGVMATGLDTIYPAYHREAAARMVRNGGLLTDFPVGTQPVAINFVRRNRIIAGLADATILVESKKDGGGVISAKMASAYNREVFAVPGRVGDELSEGCNLLIKENCAEMVAGANTIRSAMGWKNVVKDGVLKTKFLTFESDNSVKRKIVSVLYQNMQATVDDLIEKTGCGRSDIVVNLTELELEQRIRSDLSGRFRLL